MENENKRVVNRGDLSALVFEYFDATIKDSLNLDVYADTVCVKVCITMPTVKKMKQVKANADGYVYKLRDMTDNQLAYEYFGDEYENTFRMTLMHRYLFDD